MHCLNCGRKFSGVYERRRHERLVKCEKKEIYNDIEILVRLEKLEKELNESKEKMENLEKELLILRSVRGSGSVGVGVGVGGKRKKNIKIKIEKNKNIKQKKILEYGYGF